jgi:putative ABC transport system permease protein
MTDKRENREKDLDRELKDHLELDAETKMDGGMRADEARYAAQRDFGNTAMVKEVTREMWAWNFLARFLQDVKYGLRLIGRNPGFTAVAILTLALGIGANTAIFSIVNAVFLRPLPFPDSDRVFVVARSNNRIGGNSISYPIYLAWKEQQGLFDSLGLATYQGNPTVAGHGDPERVPAYAISIDVLPMLGTKPAIGRGFQPEEAKPGAPRAALLSDAFWRRKFSADPSIVGQVISINGIPHVIEGVMPAGFEFPLPVARDVQVWRLYQVPVSSHDPTNIAFCIGRLAPGVSRVQAEAALTVPFKGLHDQYEKMIAADERGKLITLHEFVAGRAGTAPLILLGAVGLVLLIACANVANLLLARATSRKREIAVRAALGATRSQLLWQLLTESVLLGLAGGLAGILVCYASFNSILSLVPANLPHVGAIQLDGKVLVFSLALGILTGLIFGLAPAMQASAVDLQSSLKEGTSGGGYGKKRGRLRSALVVSEVGMSLVLLVGAALLFQSFLGLLHTKTGFDSHNVMKFEVALPRGAAYDSKAKRLAFFDSLDAKLSSLPGVQQVSYASVLPFAPGAPDMLYSVEGDKKFDGKSYDAGFRFVNQDYFRSLHIPIVRGREFTNADSSDAEPVVLINEAMAREIWPDSDPIGQHIWLGKPMGKDSTEPAPRRIVGVVGDIYERSLWEEPESLMYIPYPQSNGGSDSTTFVVRASQDPAGLAPAIRENLRALAPDLPLSGLGTLDDLVTASLVDRRFPTILLSLFGAVALLIAAVGVYGVISYSVAQRTHEIGIRVALGASRGRILGMVLSQGMRLAAIGAVLGLIALHWLTRLLIDLLYGIRPSDPLTLAGATLALLAVAFLACWIPARRATRIDPLIALRYE